MNNQLELIKRYAKNRNIYLLYLKKNNGIPITLKKGGNTKGLSDFVLNKHLCGDYTVGVRPYENKSSFIGIDIDYRKQPIVWVDIVAVAERTVAILLELGMPKESLVVSKSGMKGIHIDILFSDYGSLTDIKRLLDYVVDKLNLDKEYFGIDKRGCNQAGYKLPLGLHFKTNTWCELLNCTSFTEVAGFEEWYSGFALLNKDNWGTVLSKLNELTKTNVLSENKIKNTVDRQSHNLKKGTIAYDDYVVSINEMIEQILESNQLLTKGSRNYSMFYMSLYYNSENIDFMEALEKGSQILTNTPEYLFTDESSIDWKIDKWTKELIETYEKNKTLYSSIDKVIITESAVLEILSLKRYNLMRVAFLHYLMNQFKPIYNIGRIQAKRLLSIPKDTFINNNTRLLELNWIELVKQGGNHNDINIANSYKLVKKFAEYGRTMEKPFDIREGSLKLPSFQKSVSELLTINQIKKVVSKKVYETYFHKEDILTIEKILGYTG